MPFSAQHILAILFGDMVHSDRVSVRKRQGECERKNERIYASERVSERKSGRKRKRMKEEKIKKE